MQHTRDGAIRPGAYIIAVRAIVPVTQMPENSAEPILANPCADKLGSSSDDVYRSYRLPRRPRADLIAPSSVNEIAAGRSVEHLVDRLQWQRRKRQRVGNANEAAADRLDGQRKQDREK